MAKKRDHKNVTDKVTGKVPDEMPDEIPGIDVAALNAAAVSVPVPEFVRAEPSTDGDDFDANDDGDNTLSTSGISSNDLRFMMLVTTMTKAI